MPQISVIVPVYNAEKYLARCIESLIKQTFEDIQIILVNDGSKDNSQHICELYQRQDSRILLINKKNEGAGKARRDGVAVAKGEFLCFVDSDDFVNERFCEALIRAQQVSNADLVECGYYVESKTRKFNSLFSEDKVLNKEDFRSEIIAKTIVDGTVAVVLWNKLYRARLFREEVLLWGDNVLEDYLINMQYYLKVDRYVYINKPLLHYCVVFNSLSRGFQKNLFAALKEVVAVKLKYMELYQMNESSYLQAHANWYIRYVCNYLERGCLMKEFRTEVIKIIQDETIMEACLICNPTPFSRAINKKKFKKAFKYLLYCAKIKKLKRVIYKITNK